MIISVFIYSYLLNALIHPHVSVIRKHRYLLSHKCIYILNVAPYAVIASLLPLATLTRVQIYLTIHLYIHPFIFVPR